MIKIYKYGEVSNDEIFARENIDANVEGIVADIIANVVKNGDKALAEYCERFDKVKLDSFEAVELLSSLEEEFGVKLKTAQIKKLKTVGDVAALIDVLCTGR